MKKRLIHFIDPSRMEPSNSERASAAFIVLEKIKGEWRLLVQIPPAGGWLLWGSGCWGPLTPRQKQ